MSESEAIWSGYVGGSCWSRELIITPRWICGQEACSLPFSFLPRHVILPLPSPGLIMCLKQWGCLTLGCEPVDLHCEQWAETNLLPSQLLPGVSVVIRKFKGFNHSWLLMCRRGRLRRKATELILSVPFQPGSEGQMLIAALSPLESSFLRCFCFAQTPGLIPLWREVRNSRSVFWASSPSDTCLIWFGSQKWSVT